VCQSVLASKRAVIKIYEVRIYISDISSEEVDPNNGGLEGETAFVDLSKFVRKFVGGRLRLEE
jgi:hypothetical protein